MLLTFNTAFKDNNLNLVILNRKKIIYNYLKLWFWIDFISTIPY